MMGRMSLARCCCVCEDCCNGASPTEFDVTFTLPDSHCTTCDETLDGTFTLTLAPPYGGLSICRWGYYRSWPSFPYTELCRDASTPYNPFDNDYLISQQVYLRVTCINDTQYFVRAWMIIAASIYGTTGVYNGLRYDLLNWYQWGEYVNVSEWPCDGVTDWCLPFQFRSSSLGGAWVSESPSMPEWSKWLCDPTLTEACVTAAP